MLLLALPAAGLLWDLFSSPTTRAKLFYMLLVIFWVVCIYFLFSIRYILDEKELKVKSLFYSRSYPIDMFQRIEYTRNPLSAPAASLDRLELFYSKNDSIIISPKQKEEFVAEMQKLNPNIQIIK